jgi:two-component system response regulator YesN
MRQVMIVDDERWIRRGLIQSIPWDELGIELAGEAGDGGDAYDMVLEKKPDILFLDMRMPGLDGKQLLGLLRRELPELLTIVVSGYSDFEYTKEAIRNRAFDYLLKPVKKEELTSILKKALAKLDEQEALKSKSFRDSRENWLLNVLFHQEQSPSQELSIVPPLPDSWLDKEAMLLIAVPDLHCDCYDTQHVANQLQKKLIQEKGFYMGGAWDFAITTVPGGTGEIVISVVAELLKLNEVQHLIITIKNLLIQQGKASYSIGISDRTDDVRAMPQAYKQAKQSLSGKKLGTAGVLLHPSPATGNLLTNYPQDKEDVLLLTLQLGNEGASVTEFNRFYQAIAADGMTVDYLQQSAAMLVHSLERQLHASQTSLEELSGRGPLSYMEMFQLRKDAVSIRAIFEAHILAPIIAYYGRPGANQGERIVREIQKLIEVHYAQPLSLQQIAESRFLNPDYLSRLFKKTTGHNFVDYITEYRIAKSIEFLKLSNYKNYEIAKKVGYEDYRYFSQIFKKKIGMTIGEFRDSQQPTTGE